MTKLKTGFGRAEDSPGFMLWKASNLLQRLHAGCLRDLGVTPTQFSLMTCLVYLSDVGPVTPTSLAAHSGMDRMMVSDLIKSLEKKRLLVRCGNPSDGRSFLVVPTAQGRRITNASVRRIEALDREFFKNASDAGALLADLVSLVDGGAMRRSKRATAPGPSGPAARPRSARRRQDQPRPHKTQTRLSVG